MVVQHARLLASQPQADKAISSARNNSRLQTPASDASAALLVLERPLDLFVQFRLVEVVALVKLAKRVLG